MTAYAVAVDAINEISTVDELRALNRMINFKVNALNSSKKWAFRIGDDVKFCARGQWRTGKVVKIMQKNIRVDVGVMRWTVAPSLLEKA
jgi:hypothetical protein